MTSLRQPKQLAKFSSFLIENGAAIQDPTSTWEILRYKLAGSGTVIIHRNAKGDINIPDDARYHLECFKNGKAIERKRRPGSDHKQRLVKRLLDRDGDACCICAKPLGDDITVEHWVSIKDGGTNGMANLGLAHEKCNQAVDSKPVSEKVKIAMEMNDERA